MTTIAGPISPCFSPLPVQGNISLDDLREDARLSEGMRSAAAQAPQGSCVAWGIPFEVEGAVLLIDEPVTLPVGPVQAGWLVFMHTTDLPEMEKNVHGFYSPMHGQGKLNEPVADYVIHYEDGDEARLTIRRRYQIGTYTRIWGENCFEAVAAHKPTPL